jgi:cytochrome P450
LLPWLPWLREMREEDPVWRGAHGVWRVFRPKVGTELAARIAEITHELLDATGGASEFDLVAALAYPLPVTGIWEAPVSAGGRTGVYWG